MLARVFRVGGRALVVPCFEARELFVDDLAYRHILTGLVDIHALNYIHEDVRWANVLMCGDLYFLIDYEVSVRAGRAIPLPLPRVHAPELDGQIAPKAAISNDLWLVGNLLSDRRVVSFELSSGARAFQEHMMGSRRPRSAQDALNHFWLSA